MTRSMRLAVACIVAIAFCAACKAGGASTPRYKVDYVGVSITCMDTAQIVSVLVDQGGRRCGGTQEEMYREIRGCEHQFNWPAEGASGGEIDSLSTSPMSLGDFFAISDSAGVPGLLEDGTCELHVMVKQGGRLRIAAKGGRGISLCSSTRDVHANSGQDLRLRLAWNLGVGKCSVLLTPGEGSDK
jgi:hypothetical protein